MSLATLDLKPARERVPAILRSGVSAQENLITSALSIARHLRLGSSDRCLNPMPLFHIHGLVAGLLAPVAT